MPRAAGSRAPSRSVASGSTMSSTSRALALAASVAMLPGACTGTAVRGSEKPRRETAVVIGAGSVGSDYYPLGGAVCRLVNLETARHGTADRRTARSTRRSWRAVTLKTEPGEVDVRH